MHFDIGLVLYHQVSLEFSFARLFSQTPTPTLPARNYLSGRVVSFGATKPSKQKSNQNANSNRAWLWATLR
jgi:hypothetical protein